MSGKLDVMFLSQGKILSITSTLQNLRFYLNFTLPDQGEKRNYAAESVNLLRISQT